MPEVGVRITADAVEFMNAMKRVERQTEEFKKSFESRMQSLGNVIKTALGAFVGIQGLSGLLALTDSMDKLIKDARTLGLAADVFADISEKAAIAGVDAETLRSALINLQKVLASARDGGVQAAQALGVLGLRAEQLIELPFDEQLRHVVTALQELSQEDRLVAATEIFGKAGKEIVKISPEALVGDKGGLAAAFGAIGSQGQAAIEKLSDAFATIASSAKSVGVLLLATISPAIDAVSRAVAAFTKFITDNAASVMTLVRWGLVLSAVLAAWRGVIAVVTTAMAAYRAALAAVAAVKAFLVALSAPLAGALAVTAAAAVAAGAVIMLEFSNVTASAAQASEKIDDVGNAAEGLVGRARGSATVAQVIAGTSKAATEAAEAIKRLNEETAKTFVERQKVGRLALDINVPRFAVDIEQQFAGAKEKAEARLAEIRRAIEELSPSLQRVREQYEQMRAAMGQSFGLDEQSRAIENQISVLSGRLQQLREQEAKAVEQLGALEKQRSQLLQTTAGIEASKRIRELNEEIDKLLGKDFERFLTQLERAGLQPQGGEMLELMKLRAARDVAEAARAARDMADELARAAQENELIAQGFTDQQAKLEMLRRQIEVIEPARVLDPERAQVVRAELERAADALRRFQETTLLRDAAGVVSRLREAAAGIPSSFAEAARNAALLNVAVERGLVNAQEHGRLMEQLLKQVGHNIMQNFSQLRPIVRGSVEEARLILQQQAQGQARDMAREILPQLAQIARQQLEVQHRIVSALERAPAPGVVP